MSSSTRRATDGGETFRERTPQSDVPALFSIITVTRFNGTISVVAGRHAARASSR